VEKSDHSQHFVENFGLDDPSDLRGSQLTDGPAENFVSL
jgi:hypothetical protein